MSESETMGQCRSEVDSYRKPEFHYAAIADAIDRLAADVAAVKEAILLQTTEERDAAIRERDEARAEAQRIQDEADDQEQTDKVKRLNAEIDKIHYTLMNRTWERDEARAEVERLRAELAARQPAAPPVVVLPTVFQHSSLGDKLVALQQVRDALDKAGVPWIGGGA